MYRCLVIFCPLFCLEESRERFQKQYLPLLKGQRCSFNYKMWPKTVNYKRSILESLTCLSECQKKKVSLPYGEATGQMSFGTSQLLPLTLLLRISIKNCLTFTIKRHNHRCFSAQISCQVVVQEHLAWFLFILLILLELD